MSLELWGYPVQVVLEVQMPRGHTVRVPVSNPELIGSSFIGAWHELRIPIQRNFIHEVVDTIDEVQLRAGV